MDLSLCLTSAIFGGHGLMKHQHGEFFSHGFNFLVKDIKGITFGVFFNIYFGAEFAETILNQCFVAGDEEVKTSDEYFLGAAGQLEHLMEVKNAELKKL